MGPDAELARDARVVVRSSALGHARSSIVRGRSSGPLRLLFPRTSGRAAWVVTSSLGGGLVDGDRVALDVDVGSGAVCLLTSQASQKVYRGRCASLVSVRVAAGGVLLAVPDPTVPYADASFLQRSHIELDEGASLAWMDVVTAGRVARGERWAARRIDLGLELACAGRVALRDRVVLDADVAPIGPKMRRFDALATVVLVGPAFADLAAAALVRPQSEGAAIGAGTVAGGAFVRIAAETVGGAIALTRDLVGAACSRFDEDPFGRKW